MKNRKIICTLLLLIGSTGAKAQLAAYKTVLASAGKSYSSAGLSADWTVGQNVVNQYTSSGLIVTEGFHPVYIASQAPNSVATVSNNITSVETYPNPTNAILHIVLQQHEPKPVSMQVLDVTGKVVQNIITLPAQIVVNAEIDLSAVNPGTYIILMNANTQDAYTMKVTKQ